MIHLLRYISELGIKVKNVSSFAYLQSSGLFFFLVVTEGFIEEAEETIYFRVSPNAAFLPNCSQIDPDHLFENRLHTAEECITCP